MVSDEEEYSDMKRIYRTRSKVYRVIHVSLYQDCELGPSRG